MLGSLHIIYAIARPLVNHYNTRRTSKGDADVFHLLKTEWRKVKFPVLAITFFLTVVMSVLASTLHKNYTLNFRLEAWEVGTELFSFIFPLVVVSPLCWNLYYERKNHFLLYVSSRTSISRYLTAKWCIHSISAFVILCVPYFASALSALYMSGPINQAKTYEESTAFQHVFLNTFIHAPLRYALVLSVWRGVLGILVMTLGFVLSLYLDNIFVILTGPFVYTVLENFTFAILRLERYRLAVSFDPTSIAPERFTAQSVFIGPVVLCFAILIVWVVCSKVKKIAIVEV